jgi:hypothetical protein
VRTVLAVAVALAALAGAAPAGAITIDNRLVFLRPDGTEARFGGPVRVWCGPWERDVPVRSIHVRVGLRAGRAWHLSAVLADVRRDPVVRLPHAFIWDRPTGALLFAADGTNELSSAEEEASGRLTFRRARCGPRLRIRVRVDATLGSEFSDGEPLRVRGLFRASK